MDREQQRMERAFDALADQLAASARWLRSHPFYEDPSDRAAGHMFVVSMLVTRLEEEVLHDPAFPTFRIVDPRIREGGDNPDQRYLISRLEGGEAYRIWGRLVGERRLDLQVYAGDPYVFGSGGRSAGYLAHEEISFGADGTFEVIASPVRSESGDWIENPPDGTRILVRQVYGEWHDREMGEVHIDRVGAEGELKPVLTEAEMADRLERATRELATHVEVWPEILRQFYVDGQEANQVSRPFDPGAMGGVSGRYMCHAVWDLAPDEALVLRTWPMDGDYQGVQLADLWWSSLEYGNRQTSLTGEQAELGSDGAFTFVVAGRDPGVANWLDTTGRRRGIVMLRFDGMRSSAFAEELRPTAQVVRLDELADALPPTTARIDTEARRRALAARRRISGGRLGWPPAARRAARRR
jgi:hypothetical protein